MEKASSVTRSVFCFALPLRGPVTPLLRLDAAGVTDDRTPNIRLPTEYFVEFRAAAAA